MGAVGSIFNQSDNEELTQEVIESWEEIKNNYGADNLGKKVFKKLFEQYPETIKLFKTFADDEDWENSRGFAFHSKTVITMIGTNVASSKSISEIRTSLTTVGKAHQFFGLKKIHFDLIGKELIIALEEILGDKFNDSVKKKWINGYDIVAKVMLEAMTASSNIRN